MGTSRGFTLRTVVLLLSAALLMTTTVVQAVASATISGTPAEEPDIAYLVETYGVSADEAADRLASQQELPMLVALAARDHPETFAGGWIDHAQGGLLKLAFTEVPPNIDELTLHSEHKDRVVVEGGRLHTLQQLLRINWRLSDDAMSLRARGEPAFGVQLHTVGNIINVYPESPGTDRGNRSLRAARQVIERHKAQSHTRVLGQEYAAADDGCVNTECDPPLRGGIKIRARGRGGCSTGFIATETPAPPAITFYVFTAGHCGPIGTQIEQATFVEGDHELIGPFTRSADAGPVDAATAQVVTVNPDNDGVDFWDPARWVYHNSSAQALQIQGKIANPVAAAPGIIVCRSGGYSSVQCGEIVSSFSNPNGILGLIGLANSGLLETNLCSAPGDSGGPVYTRDTNGGIPLGTAFALHTQSSVNDSCAPGERSFHTHIAFAEAQHGMFVWCAQVCNEEI